MKQIHLLFLLISKIALKDFCVADLLNSSQNVEECKELIIQIIQMMKKGSFMLRKWTLNDPTLLECILINSRDNSNSMKIS